MIIIIGKLVHAFGADFCIICSASAFVGGAFVFSESKPDNRVIDSPAYLLGYGVIGVENIGCSGGYAEFYFLKNNFRAAVADNLVAKKVCYKDIVRGDFFYKEAKPAFVDFENGKIRFYFAAESAVCEKSGGNSAEHIGAEAVVDYGKAVFTENMGYHIGGGGFSVGAGDADDLSAEFKAFEQIRANHSCNIAGFCGAFSNKATNEIEHSANADGNK